MTSRHIHDPAYPVRHTVPTPNSIDSDSAALKGKTARTRSVEGLGEHKGGIVPWLCHDPIVAGGIAAALIAGHCVLLGLAFPHALLVAAFSGTALVYWGDRVLGFSPEDRHAHPERVAWIRRHRTWMLVEGLAFAGLLGASVVSLRAETIAVAGLCGVLGALHVAPLLPGRRRMKGLRWGKTSTIVLAWAVGSVVLPWLEAGPSGASTGAVAAVMIGRSLVLYANVMVAGWTDREGDQRAGLPAAQQMPEETLRKTASWLAFGGGLVLVLVGALSHIPIVFACVDAAAVFCVAYFIRYIQKQKRPFHMLWLDLAVAWPGVLVLLSAFGYEGGLV